ncbi:TPA: hypothetical protein RQJ95_000253 [Vibrio vulnificus]|nr:hypothetical protein [Vibrio vulnificus]
MRTIKILSVAIGAALLSACGDSSGLLDYNGSTLPSPNITALSIEGEPIGGNTLIAQVDCIGCETSKYTYEWFVDGLPQGNSSTYIFRPEDLGKTIKLNVSGENEFAKKDNASVEYVNVIPTDIYAIQGGFAALMSDGTIVPWGFSDHMVGCNSEEFTNSGTKAIYNVDLAFVVDKGNNQIVTCGAPNFGGDSSSVDLSAGIKEVHPVQGVIVAIMNDNSVRTWGDGLYSGSLADISAVDFSSGVRKIFSSVFGGIVIAEKINGDTVAWGEFDSSGVDFSSGVKFAEIAHSAATAVMNDGRVISWGNASSGGDSSGVDFSAGVQSILTNQSGAFVTLMNDGGIKAWGRDGSGGNVDGIDFSAGVKELHHIYDSFVALMKDDSVRIWGRDYSVDSIDFSPGVASIYSSSGAFLALMKDGSIRNWGVAPYGGGDSSGIDVSAGIKNIYPSDVGFVIVLNDGTVQVLSEQLGDISNIDFSAGIKEIYEASVAYTALMNDGSTRIWGHPLVINDTGDSVELSFLKQTSSTL